MSDWQPLLISDLGRVVTGKTPPTKQQEYYDGPYPFITPTDIRGDMYCETARSVSEEGRAFQKNLLLPARAVCVTCIASVGKICMTSVPSFTNQQINSIIVDEAQHDPFFVYYLMQTQVDYLKRIAGGAASPIVNKSAFSEIEVSVPDLPTQRRIAGILSAYDELIANNQRRIAILEEMARALYREWFVYYRAPGVVMGEDGVPEGWEVKPLLELANVTYGFPFDSKQFNTAGEGTPIIRIRDIPTGATETFTRQDAAEKYHVYDGEILVGMDGDFHMCMWSSGHAYQNQRVAKFTSRGAIGNYHLFLALEQPIQELNRSIVGTTVAHLGANHIKDIKVMWPTHDIAERFKINLEPMAQQQLTLKKQTANLRRTRDLLLPRLMSGRVELEPA